MAYQAHDLVWVFVKGFPWWPSRIVPEEDLPDNILSIKPKHPAHPAWFYGTGEYGWYRPENIAPYDQNADKYRKLSKSKAFLRALDMVNDPNIKGAPKRNREEEARQLAAQAEAQAQMAQSQPSDLDVKRRSKKRVRDSVDPTETGDASDANLHARKRRASAALEPADKRPRKPRAEARRAHPDAKTPFDRLLRLRMKLQKFMQANQASRSARDFEKADAHLQEVEAFSVSFDLLRETKIGKVIRRISGMDFDEDKFDIVERCKKVLNSWKELVPVEREESIEGDAVSPVGNLAKESVSEQDANEEDSSSTADKPHQKSPSPALDEEKYFVEDPAEENQDQETIHESAVDSQVDAIPDAAPKLPAAVAEEDAPQTVAPAEGSLPEDKDFMIDASIADLEVKLGAKKEGLEFAPTTTTTTEMEA